MWLTAMNVPTAASHPVYRRLNQLRREHGFQAQCAGFSAATMAALACPRSISFGLLLIGYVEGIDSECGESLERLLPDELFGPLSSAAPTPHALRHRRHTLSSSNTATADRTSRQSFRAVLKRDTAASRFHWRFAIWNTPAPAKSPQMFHCEP